MRTEPVVAAERPVTAGSRVLLLMDAAGDRRVLASWLSEAHEVIQLAPDDALAADFDLCVLDDPAFARTWKRIATRKRESEPVFLPFVLLTSARTAPLVAALPTHDIDEVLEAPVSPEALVSRVDVLLERRMRERRLAEARDGAVERLQAAREHAQQELETTRLLLEAATTLSASLDLTEVLTRLADIALKFTGLTRAFVNLIDVDAQVLTPIVATGGLMALSGPSIPFDRLSKTSMKAILARETAVLDYELAETPEYDRKIAEANNSKLVLFVPLLVGGEMVGHIALDEPGERHQFSEREIEFVQGVASQAGIVVKNAQLYGAEEQAARDAQALNRINDAIHSTLDFDEIMNRVVVEANAAFGSESASIVVKEGDRWTVRYAAGFETEIVGLDIPEEQRGFMEAIERAGEPLIIEDATKDSRLPAGWVQRFSFSSFLAVPLSVRGETLGVMFFNFHREPRPISAAKANFARKLTPTVSLALGNSRLYGIEHESLRLNQALNTLDQDIHSSLATKDILARVVPAAATALGCEAAAMGVRDGNGWIVRHEYRLQEGLVGRRFSDHELQVARRAVDEQDVQVVDDAVAHPDLNQETRALFEARSILVVPLIAREQAVGVIYFIYRSKIHHFSKAEADFARRLSVSLGLAIVNARLFEAERANREREEALKSVAQAASASLEPGDFATRISETVARLFGAKQAQIRLLNQAGTVLEPTGAFDPEGFLESIRIPVDGDTETARAFRTGERKVGTNIAASGTDESKRNAASAGIASYVLVPIRLGSEAVGILYIGWAQPREFSDEELSFLDAVMGQFKSGLQNARLYATERDIADRLQEALLTLPEAVPGIEFANAYHSASEAARVGGDFYDLFPLNHDHVGVVIGDVAGKGLDAAVLTSMVKNTLRAHASERGKTPKEIVTLTNDVVYRATPTESFVTVFFGILDCRDGRLVYSNAGHTTAAVVRQDGSAGKLAVTGPLLGAFANVEFDQAEACLDFDETLFLYTDGLTEARRDHELFGEERLFAFLESTGVRPAREAVREVIEEVIAFTGNRLRDDLALLAVKRVAQGAEAPHQQKLEM